MPHFAGRHFLLLLRHAKSDWDDPNLSDHDRPLAARGRLAAPKMARHIARTDVLPDLVLCSTAVRARQTLDLIRPALPAGPRLYEPELYTFEASALLQRLQQCPADARTVMVVGHNPALESLALRLCSGQKEGKKDHPLHRLRHKFPTAALATLALPCPWSELVEGVGRVVDFVRPKDLSDR